MLKSPGSAPKHVHYCLESSRIILVNLNGKILETIQHSDLYGATCLTDTDTNKKPVEDYDLTIHSYKRVFKKNSKELRDSKRNLFKVKFALGSSDKLMRYCCRIYK